MDPTTIGIISVAVMLFFMALGVHVATVLAGCAIGGLLIAFGWNVTASIIAASLHASVSDYSLVLIPLFILMGSVASQSGIVEDSMNFAQKWLGGIKGSLGMAAVASCALFSAVCGSSAATSVAMGKFMIPEMKKYGYSDSLSTGTIAAAGTLGVLIPPSIIMVIFSIMTETPLALLFMAGIVPGISLAILFMVGIRVMVYLFPDAAPPPKRASWREKAQSVQHIWGVALLIAVIWGGIYGGIFTATEAGAVAAALAVVLLFLRHSLKSAWFRLRSALPEAVQGTAMIFITMVAAILFSKYLTLVGVFDGILLYMRSGEMSTVAAVLLIYGVIMVMGCFMVAIAVLLLTAPLATEIFVSMGYDPLWVGIIMILLFELANITPPVGLNTYVVKGIAPDVPMEQIFIGAGVFMVIISLFVAVLTIFPGIVLWLPNTMR